VTTNDATLSTAAAPLRISLCLLTWNERAGCEVDVPRLPLTAFDEVYAVDAGSSDGTREYLEAQGITVHQQPVPGYNQAYLHAFRTCTTDALVLFHPKGSIDPAELLKFRPLFADGYDLIIASRLVKGARNEEDERLWRPRKWFVRGLGLLAAVLWRRRGYRVQDVLHGFRGMRRNAFFAIAPLAEGVSIDLEMVVRAYRNGLGSIEFPVHERPRLSGETHFKAFQTGKRLLAYLGHELTRARCNGVRNNGL
jgi:glycosyltransferase involved in cell wall biosynthesis